MGLCLSARAKTPYTKGIDSEYVSADVNEQSRASSKGEILLVSGLNNFTLAVLKSATRNFGPDGVLGEPGFSSVFKGWIDKTSLVAAKPGTGMVIAVKRLNRESLQGHLQEWLAEVNYIGQLYHPNLVKLVGYCVEDEHRLLAFEFMPRGSLENHLFIRGSYFQPLSWSLRMKVALGAARGLAFLHETNVIHRDFKTSNILLDSCYNAKLSDFALTKDGSTCDTSCVIVRVIGTHIYAAPEYISKGQLSARSNVYSYGVVLLEMISGRRALDNNRLITREQNLVEWSKPYLAYTRKVSRVFDNRLEGQYTQECAHKAARIVLQCLSSEPELRPNMNEVVKALEELQDSKEAVSNKNSNHGSRTRRTSTGGRNTSGVAYRKALGMDKYWRVVSGFSMKK